MKATQDSNASSGTGGIRHRSYIQHRAQNFGLTMVVMGVCFALYYLGFFGGVEGPLEPGRIGERLAAMGITGRHVFFLFLLLTLVAITWNWLYNAANRWLKLDMTCGATIEKNSGPCTMPISRKKSDFAAGRYICTAGHRCTEPKYREIRKGTFAHFVWIMFLVFSVIIFCHLP